MAQALHDQQNMLNILFCNNQIGGIRMDCRIIIQCTKLCMYACHFFEFTVKIDLPRKHNSSTGNYRRYSIRSHARLQIFCHLGYSTLRG